MSVCCERIMTFTLFPNRVVNHTQSILNRDSNDWVLVVNLRYTYSKNTRGADIKGGVQQRPADTKNRIHKILKIQLCSELTLRIMDVNFSSGAETQTSFTVTFVKRIKFVFGLLFFFNLAYKCTGSVLLKKMCVYILNVTWPWTCPCSLWGNLTIRHEKG